MNILYIDDDPDDQLIFKEAVRNVSPATTCYFASTIDEGMRVLREMKTIDRIFLDINLGTVDGRHFFSVIKQEPRYVKVPIIVYSTSARKSDAVNCKLLGAEHYLTKENSFIKVCEQLSPFLEKASDF